MLITCMHVSALLLPVCLSVCLDIVSASSLRWQCYNAVMEGLARKGSWRRALALADDMDQVGLPPDARTLSILLQLDGYS